MSAVDPVREAAYRARFDFDTFCAFCAPAVLGGPLAEHQWEFARVMAAVEREPGARQIVSGPPQHGKTSICTLLWSAFVLGRGAAGLNDVLSAMLACYNHTRASVLCGAVRDLFRDPLSPVRLVFPEARLVEPASAGQWRFVGRPEHEPSMIALGVGMGTGYPAQLVILDDYVQNWQQALSEAYQAFCGTWWTGTMRTRMQVGTRAVFTATRWSDNDLVGRSLHEATGRWRYFALPAIRGEGDQRRALWSARFPLAFLDEQCVALGERDFRTQYLCDPTPDEGVVWKRSWFEPVMYRGVPPPCWLTVTSWDTAFETSSSNDHSASCRVGLDDLMRFVVLGCRQARLEFPELMRAIEFGDGAPPDEAALIERAASGRSAIHVQRREGRRQVIPLDVRDDKVIRAHAVTDLAEAGRVLLPADQPWAEDLLAELTAFPSGRHDDRHDALVNGLTWLRTRIPLRGPRLAGLRA